MVLLAFYLLCLSLLRSLVLPLWLRLSLRSLPYLSPGAPVTFSSSLALSAAPHGFIAHSLTFLSSAGSSSSSLPPGSSGVFRFLVVYLFLSSVSGGGSGVAPGFGAVPVSRSVSSLFFGYFSFPSFRWGSNSFRGGSCGYSPFKFTFRPFCSGVLSGYFFVVFCRSSSFSFGSFLRCSSWVPGDAAPAAWLHDADSVVPSAVLGSVRSESSLMLVFLKDRFPQALGAHSAPPSSTVFWSWSVRVHTVLFLILILAWSLFLSYGRTSVFSFLATLLLPSGVCSL